MNHTRLIIANVIGMTTTHPTSAELIILSQPKHSMKPKRNAVLLQQGFLNGEYHFQQ
jgi:hypothetical protein